MLLLEPGWNYRSSSPFWLDARFACGVIALKRVTNEAKRMCLFGKAASDVGTPLSS
jgi:hypothetical protein